MSQSSSKSSDAHPLDAVTGGAFSAPTSGERAARVRDWLATEPGAELMAEVFKELSARDKGAARALREKLDEIKRAKGQEAIAAEWAAKAQDLLAQPRLNIADAMAWQRDAAKAGAPLSREPLAAFKTQLADRVKAIEDLQTRVQVQREAAVLLAQRIEVLSTKSWRDAEAAIEQLRGDVQAWQAQADALAVDPGWPSIDPRFPPQVESSRVQLHGVWEAFSAALAQTVAAASDATAPLPPVPVWADEIRVLRGVPVEPVPQPVARPRIDPELRARATELVREALQRLEQEISQGHGKASAGAANALRAALREHGKWVEEKLEHQAHAALAAAGELEGWQRWRADQLREELVAKAEALVGRGPLAVVAEGAKPPQRPGGRKVQETLRQLREQWKQVDQGGVPNHALWKRFDEACNEAHKVVEAWLEKVRAESAEHRQQRLALIEEVKAWTAAQAGSTDWKSMGRALHQFSERWRESGHLSEKAFAELQPLWKQAISAAHEPLETAQKDSIARRQALIAEATELGAAPQLRIDAVKALQQRWQVEAQSVPLDRKQEQKLWDAFRKPIDEAFQRKGQERERATAALSERDRAVLEASRAVEAASATGDAQQIRAALAALEKVLAQGAGPAPAAEAAALARAQAPATGGDAVTADVPTDTTTDATTDAASRPTDASDGGSADAASSEASTAAPAPQPSKPARPVVAVRGDDRPGQKKTEPVPAMRGGRPGDRRDAGRPGARGPRDEGRGGRDDARGPRDRRTDGFEPRGPRLGDAAFRALRDAQDRAQLALRKLAAQAHGEALTQLLAAWEQRSADALPSQAELGRAVSPQVRSRWSQVVSAPATGDAGEALLRLEMAAEVPSPAEQQAARRQLQLVLLTRRNDPAPAQTWADDAARVLATAHDGQQARRLQAALKVLLRR